LAFELSLAHSVVGVFHLVYISTFIRVVLANRRVTIVIDYVLKLTSYLFYNSYSTASVSSCQCIGED